MWRCYISIQIGVLGFRTFQVQDFADRERRKWLGFAHSMYDTGKMLATMDSTMCKRLNGANSLFFHAVWHKRTHHIAQFSNSNSHYTICLLSGRYMRQYLV